MKIVKSFNIHRPGALSVEWGLSDEGRLYFRYFNPYVERNLTKEWSDYETEYRTNPPFVPFRDMRKIVKEFGHLIVFT